MGWTCKLEYTAQSDRLLCALHHNNVRIHGSFLDSWSEILFNGCMPQTPTSFTDALQSMGSSPMPTPVAKTNPALPHAACDGKNCDNCVKGGMPFKRETLSFIVVVLIGLSTLFFALWVVAMRERDALKGGSAQTNAPSEQAAAKPVEYSLPAEKTVLKTIALPKPSLAGKMSVEAALATRRSRRAYAETPLTLQQISQVLWSAQGVTDDAGHRTAPSARGAYPYTVYMVARNVAGLDAGLYRYNPTTHSVEYLGVAGAGEALIAAGVQDNSQKAPAVLALAASYAKMAKLSPADPVTGTLIEAGHIGQNIYLQIESLGMGTVVTAGFDAVKVGAALELDPNEDVVYLVPFGNRGVESVEK